MQINEDLRSYRNVYQKLLLRTRRNPDNAQYENEFQQLDILALKGCTKTYFNWVAETRNALEVPYSNGPMEGYNNKIKTLKRVAFGFRNFTHFKARILLMGN